jgi:ribonuclease Z
MKFELTILGSSGAMPFKDRYMTAQVLNVREQLFLIDCGEGTQMRMSRYRVKRGKIDHIFISHLHGDHVFGLPGLLTSFGMNMRKNPLHIYSPPGLKAMIDGLFPYEGKGPGFDLIYHELDTTLHQLVFENKEITVHSIPLQHGIPCNGYLFREKPKARKMIKEKIGAYNIPFKNIPAIKAGADWQSPNGALISNDELTLPPARPRSFAFCSDTAYAESIIPIIQDVDLLYHEATFLHEDLDKAIATNHTTALQAATIAKKANAKKLVLGHYSARYDEIDAHLAEAKPVFTATKLGVDGGVFEV